MKKTRLYILTFSIIPKNFTKSINLSLGNLVDKTKREKRNITITIGLPLETEDPNYKVL